MTVGEIIRRTRKAKNMTQKQLGEASGIAEPTIRKYESGRLNPKRETLHKIATALEVSTIALLPEEDLVSLSIDKDHFVAVYQCPDEENPWELTLLEAFEKLNLEGQQKAVERVEELTEIPKYKK